MSNISLLYVEDDKEALEDVVFLLKRYFSIIYTANDGEEALEVFYKNKPDILLLDINIPKIDGLELANIIKEDNEDIPIIFLTAHNETQKLLKAINLRVISYIIKPFSMEELSESILKSIDLIKKRESFEKFLLLENGFSWNKEKSELFFNEEKINITKNEIQLITYLIKNKSNFFNAKCLAEIIFENTVNDPNSITQLISRFKKKINKKINNDLFFIENIYGEGYRIK